MLLSSIRQRKHWIIFIIPLILATVLYSIYVISSGFREPENFSIPFLLQTILFFYIYLFSIDKAEQFAETSLKIKAIWGKRLVAFLIALGVSQILTLSLYAMLKQFYISYLGQNDVLNIYHLTSRALSTIFGFSLMYSIYISIKIYNESLEKELKLEQAKHAQLSLRYNQLSSKLDPHFLFNNLNTLHTLLPQNAQQAEKFIVSLSKILRYSLQQGKEELISLEQELKLLQEYIEITKSRFGDALQVRFEIKHDSNWLLFPMTLIHLMENAIKHNEVSEDKPLEVSISEQDKHLYFKNNRNPKIQNSSLGGSLSTLQELYQYKTNSKLKISKSKDDFIVSIPLIKPYKL